MPSKNTEKKLDLILKYLAEGRSVRCIQSIVNVDRRTIRKWFNFGYKIPPHIGEHLANLVIKNKLKYKDIMKKYGKKGLNAIYLWKIKKRRKNNLDVAKQILKWRKIGLSYSDIQELTGRSLSSIRYLLSLYGNKALVGNVLFKKCMERDKKLFEDYKKGLNIQELSMKYGRSPITIRLILREKFGVYKPVISVGQKYYDKISFLLSKKFTWNEIGYIIGYSSDALRRSYNQYSMRRSFNEKEKYSFR